MLRYYDMQYLTKDQYCITTHNGSENFYAFNPANCRLQDEQTSMKILNAYAMVFSIPFMVLTIIVYLSLPELRNEHGKSLICYLAGLIVGYSCLASVSLIPPTDLDPSGLFCKVLGYTSYYFFMVAFFWLSVISFDLWYNFRGTRRFHEKKRFLYYALYGWGLPLIFFVITVVAQEHLDIPHIFKPGIGNGEYCWLKMEDWSALIYFFGPIMLIITVNTIMFIMTASKIHRVQQEMVRIMAREDSTRNLRNEKDRFGLFLRLFIVMGVTWSLEIASYFVGTGKTTDRVFYIADICNAVQGVLIFLLFVMKQKVKKLIVNRIQRVRSQKQTENTTVYNRAMDQRFRALSLQIRQLISIRNAFLINRNSNGAPCVLNLQNIVIANT